MADYEDVYAPDLAEETESTLSGSEQFVMFDSVEGKRAELSTIADYIVENGEIDGSDIPTIVSTIEGNIGTVDTKVGNLTDLETTDKTDIVSAINEVNGKAEDADEKADTADEHVGDLSDLETEDKTSAVDAINEVLSKIPVMTKEVTGNPIVVDDALGAVDSLTVDLEPIQTGTPSPSDPVPITGHDSVTVTDRGRNMLNPSTITVGKYYNVSMTEVTASDKAHSDIITVKPSTSYCLNGFAGSGIYAMLALDADQTPIATWYGGASKTAPFVATTPANAYYMVLNFNADQISTIAFYESSTVDGYIEYHGQTKTVTLPHTVYGGDVDVTGGAGKETQAKESIRWGDKIAEYAPAGNQFKRRTFALSNVPITGAGHSITNCVADYNVGTPTTVPYYYVSTGPNLLYIWLPVDTDDNFEIQICYELAAPTALSTTPTDITLYNGDNVVSSDGNMDMVYVRDIVKVIEKLEG